MVTFGRIIMYKVFLRALESLPETYLYQAFVLLGSPKSQFHSIWVPTEQLWVQAVADTKKCLSLWLQNTPQSYQPHTSFTKVMNMYVVYWLLILLSFRDYIGRPYQSENEGHFVNDEPVYVPRSTMVDIIYRLNISSPRLKSYLLSSHILYYYILLYTIYYILYTTIGHICYPVTSSQGRRRAVSKPAPRRGVDRVAERGSTEEEKDIWGYLQQWSESASTSRSESSDENGCQQWEWAEEEERGGEGEAAGRREGEEKDSSFRSEGPYSVISH